MAKRNLITGFGIILVCWLSIASATDSTDSRLNPSTVTVQPASIFILDWGYHNFPGGSSTASYDICTNRVCPAPFLPYATLTLYKTWHSDGTPILLCVNTVTATSAGGTYCSSNNNYDINYTQYMGSDSGGIALYWSVFCYNPRIYTNPGYMDCSN